MSLGGGGGNGPGTLAARDLPPAVSLSLVRAALPACAIDPAEALPGELVTVTASGLAPSMTTHVLLGPGVVAAGTTDARGETSSVFMIPAGLRPGPHLVTIGVDEPTNAVTADCSVGVLAPGAPGSAADSLDVTRGSGSLLALAWSGSCATGDIDYEIYEGSLGAWYSHVSRLCSTAGATTATIEPAAGDTYYLIVPSNGSREGSYGSSSAAVPRPPGASACRPQQSPACL